MRQAAGGARLPFFKINRFSATALPCCIGSVHLAPPFTGSAYAGPLGPGRIPRRPAPHPAAMLLFAAGADLATGDVFGWFWTRDFGALDWQTDYLRDRDTELMIAQMRAEPGEENEEEEVYLRSAFVFSGAIVESG